MVSKTGTTRVSKSLCNNFLYFAMIKTAIFNLTKLQSPKRTVIHSMKGFCVLSVVIFLKI